MNRKILFAELLIILLPISIISISGAAYILAIMIFEKIHFIPLVAILYISAVVLSILGLSVLIVEVIFQLYQKTILKNNLLRFFLHMGAFIAFLSIISLFSLLVNPQSKDNYGSLAFLAVAAPALVPYFHVMLIYKNANKLSHQDAEKHRASA